MVTMIQEYETTREQLLQRIHEINRKLRNHQMKTMERERLERRRELLTIETIDLLHGINEMRRHI